VAIIRDLLRGKTAAVRQNARDASTAVSVFQIFTDAADVIGSNLTRMKELAKKASSPDYSRVQVEEMQKEFEKLAKEINEIAKSTKIDSAEYDYNKLFTAEGKAVSISIGDGSRIDIFARDLSFDAAGLSLAADPAGALSEIEEAIEDLSEYNGYLTRQTARLEDATAVIELELESAMGVDLSEFDVDVGRQVAGNMKGEISENVSVLAYIQANLTPDRALQLLQTKV
jgi:flagellin-like hook-associated protein FlgL